MNFHVILQGSLGLENRATLGARPARPVAPLVPVLLELLRSVFLWVLQPVPHVRHAPPLPPVLEDAGLVVGQELVAVGDQVELHLADGAGELKKEEQGWTWSQLSL